MLTEEDPFFEEIYSINGFRKVTHFDVSEEDKLKESYYRPLYICGTNDPVRRDLAYLISSAAWLTTIFHEAGHILHGHIDFSHSNFNENSVFILENEDDKTATEKRVVRKTVEKDADEFAGNRIVEYIFNTHYKIYLEHYGKTIKNKESLLKILFAGVTLKFLIYGIREITSDSIYLPSSYRITNILLAGYSMIKNSNYMQINKEDYEKLLTNTIKETIQAFNKKTNGIKINETLFVKQLFIGEIDDVELKKKWNEIKPKLEQYKHKQIILPPFFDLENL